jgi:hypothetical protein
VEIILFNYAGKVIGFNQMAAGRLGAENIILDTTDASTLLNAELLAIFDQVRTKQRAVYFHSVNLSQALPYGIYPLNIGEEDATLIMIVGFTDEEVKDFHETRIEREEGVAQII